MKLFADVILPLPLPQCYTYGIPGEIAQKAKVGCRVVVPLGKSKSYTAIICSIHTVAPIDYVVKPIKELLDDQPILLPIQFKLWQWISKYYLCTLGEVYKAAIPQGLKGEFKPRTEIRVRLNPRFKQAKDVDLLLSALSRAPRQQRLLNTYIELSAFGRSQPPLEVAKHALLEKANINHPIFKELIGKGIFEDYEVETGRLKQNEEPATSLYPLNKSQEKALGEIKTSFEEKNVVLLHGVTSSGKTEVYIHLIQEYLDRGEQVLYMLPEIALTKQMIERLSRVFGSRIGLYHSKFSDAERVEIWKKQLSDTPYEVILGVRSSIFLPFRNLKLIIVDEEHENSYKQQDPAPRYNARSVAMVYASFCGAKTLLGTATPSLESYYNATTGKFGLVNLSHRFHSLEMPEIKVVDIKDMARRKRMRGPFSDPLFDAICEALNNGKQIILFQNRRGYAPLLECKTCGWVPRCKHCDVSLTLHQKESKVICHYCGYQLPRPNKCPNCEESRFVELGLGTEKIEAELKKLFPKASLARMDMDTTRTRAAYEGIIDNFQYGNTDILVGTQMISKGLDFDNVAVVGILNADSLLNYPDFRASERAFQLMSQVSGRAGRRGGKGLVILQTKSPDNPIIPQVVSNNYLHFYDTHLSERMLFHYPPFYRLIYVYMKHKDIALLDTFSEFYATRLRQLFENRVLGPDMPPVARVQRLYIKKIMLKIEMGVSMYKVQEALHSLQTEFNSNIRFRSVLVYYDVDPL